MTKRKYLASQRVRITKQNATRDIKRAPRTTPIQKLALVGVNPRSRMSDDELRALQAATRWRVYSVKANQLLFSSPSRAIAASYAQDYADKYGEQVALENNDTNEALKRVRKART